ncbi:MAG TPA: PQQ-dependent sugar dehydrogenase [Bacteroidota bacterium]
MMCLGCLRTICVVFVFLMFSRGNAQYSLQEAYPGLSLFAFPLDLVHAYDGTNRLFVVQQRGVVYVFENTGAVASRKVFLNISDKVSQSGSELGLLGIAFHPDYETNRYFYVNYTTGPTGQRQSVVSRFQTSQTNPDSALKESEQILMTLQQPFDNHNGGKMVFGQDGYLYIGFGDGGSGGDPGNRAQNRAELLGKMLRIDVNSTSGGFNYAIPLSNPYAGNTQGFREEIYAYGLRNPWKFSFDSVTGKLWLGDVGQDAREEVDIIINGGNYGWRLMEGFICTPGTNPGCQDTAGLLRPVWDYVNGSGSGADGSITGGFVYRGAAIPSLYGKYVYADYISGRIWALTYDGVNPTTNQLLLDATVNISTFGEDQNKELLIVSYSSTTGRIYRLMGPATGGLTLPEAAPRTFELRQNYPNPFNPSTHFEFRIAEYGLIKLGVYNMLGQEVGVPVNEYLEPGSYRIPWDAARLPSGVYVYRLEAGRYVETKKMLLQK